MTKARLLIPLTFILVAMPLPGLAASASPVAAPLSLDEVVDNLVRRNSERAQALQHTESTRVYHLIYHGLPGDREAEMTVEASYTNPSRKDFRVLSQSGSSLIVDRVFKKLLQSEQEADQPEIHNRTILNRSNYEFALVGYELSGPGGLYVLQVTPRVRAKFLYSGRIWVDSKMV